MRQLKAIIITAIFTLGLIGCGNRNEVSVNEEIINNDSALSPIAAKYQGEYFADYQTDSKYYHEEIRVFENSITIRRYAFSSLNPTEGYYRESIGTFTESGNAITINYSKETCNQVGTEIFYVSGDPDSHLSVSQNGTILFYKNAYTFTSILNKNDLFQLVEDVDCSKFEDEPSSPPLTLPFYGQQCQDGYVPTQIGCLPQNNCPAGYGYHPQAYNGAPGCLPVTTTMNQQYPGYQQHPYQQYPYSGW